MNISNLRLLTFDVTNTLLKFKKAPGKQYSEVGIKYGILSNSNDVSKNFKLHWKKMVNEHPNFGLNTGLGWEIWWEKLIIGTFKDSGNNLSADKLNSISTHLINEYKNFTFWQHCCGALDLLSYVKHKKIPMGIISNFDPRLDITLKNAKLRHYFKFIITSYEFGIEKPDKRIFKEAMKLSEIIDLKPCECLHVGDTPALDYQGAKNAGWQAALVSSQNYNDFQKTYCNVFPTLFDLHKFLLETDTEKLIVKSER